jgi:hypothetical protein
VTAEHDTRQTILDRFAACDTATLQRLEALLEGTRDSSADSKAGYLEFLRAVAESDVRGLRRAEQSYGDSWKRRGGVDTFHMLTRKWDRVEKRVATRVNASGGEPCASPYDVFEHIAVDRRTDGLIDDVRDLRRYLLLVEAEITARSASNVGDRRRGFLDHLESVAASDVGSIEEKEKAYGSSWKRRGGIAAFMMFARKWDRIVQRVSTQVDPSEGKPGAGRDNVLEHIPADRRAEPLIDDIRDLRRYLMLVEAEMAARGAVEIGTARDNRENG